MEKPFGKKVTEGRPCGNRLSRSRIAGCSAIFHRQDKREQEFAEQIDALWRAVECSWTVTASRYSIGYARKMSFPVRGHNECRVMYQLAAASPMHPIGPEVYAKDWAENGAIVSPHESGDSPFRLRYQGGHAEHLFWTHYSFLDSIHTEWEMPIVTTISTKWATTRSPTKPMHTVSCPFSKKVPDTTLGPELRKRERKPPCL